MYQKQTVSTTWRLGPVPWILNIGYLHVPPTHPTHPPTTIYAIWRGVGQAEQDFIGRPIGLPPKTNRRRLDGQLRLLGSLNDLRGTNTKTKPNNPNHRRWFCMLTAVFLLKITWQTICDNYHFRETSWVDHLRPCLGRTSAILHVLLPFLRTRTLLQAALMPGSLDKETWLGDSPWSVEEVDMTDWYEYDGFQQD